MPTPDDSTPPTRPELSPGMTKVQNVTNQSAMAMELPFVFVAAIVVGGFFGYLLDRWLHTSPAFMLILGGVGVFAGIREVIRRLPNSK